MTTGMPSSFPSAHEHRVALADALLVDLQAVAVALGVAELERIAGADVRRELLATCRRRRAVSKRSRAPSAEVVAALRADVEVPLDLLAVDDLLALLALDPQPLGDRGLFFGSQLPRLFFLAEPRHWPRLYSLAGGGRRNSERGERSEQHALRRGEDSHVGFEVGMNSVEHKLPAETPEAELLALVQSLNKNPEVNGILVQLPLPKHINAEKVLNAIDPDKDVDGFHPVNVGRLWVGERSLVPCTPTGSVILAKSVKPSLKGLDAVVIGRSNIVGKPVAALLLRENCTVTIAHSGTRDLPAVVRQADLVVAAVGRPEMVKADWIREGAIVIDVGINRVAGAEGKSKLVGDVDYNDCFKKAGAITPVPGGVGPMTIACLLKNTVEAAKMQRGLPMA